ncbi:type II and III secretion system protein family protein [Phenylobacterium sp.]|uniref:type II and III secretion system protein family protein n=1 Tax=Phenylobacterium sp. TaxID=1871053 RepID=UPI0035B3C1D6
MNARKTGGAPARRLLTAAAALALTALAGTAAAQPSKPGPDPRSPEARLIQADAAGYGGRLALPTGGSQVLRFQRPIGRVMLGDPKVADVIPLGAHTLYVLGKAPGASSLTVFAAGDGARPAATMDLRVGFDVVGLTRALAGVLPGEAIDVRAEGDGLILSGDVSSSAAAARAVALAERYAPEKVVNLLAVRGPEQVMLSVHVAEVQRSALRQLGIQSLTGAWSDISPIALPGVDLDPGAVANLFGRAGIGENITLQALFTALESRGFASTLAEPTLIALSGETAVFFAGGEFPVPVPQLGGPGQTQITVEYKPYGVSVGFTPTVYGETINLLVSPEVSALDRENSVVLQGFRIPGITTRRAKTTVELRNGESFAIAGLIKRDFSDSLRGLPGASNLPVLGALFRSTSFQNNETEVVIIVTAHLAKPGTRRDFLLPTDTRQAPSAAEQLLTPNVDKPRTPGAGRP